MSSDSAAAACTADPEGPAVISDSGEPDYSMQQGKRITAGIPSTTRQIFSVFGLQMKLYSKSKTTYIWLLIALLIPILTYTGIAEEILGLYNMAPSAPYLLILLPLFIAAIPSAVAGRTLSSEFRNRVVYMNYPLPVTRTVYYTGKFLASFTLSLGIILFAFGFAVFMGSHISPHLSDVLGAALICIAGTFAITATAFGLGPLFKKGSVTITTILTIGLPLMMFILIIWMFSKFPITIEDSMRNIPALIPQFAPFHVFYLLDHGLSEANIGIFLLLAGSDIVAIDMFCIVALIWGLVFLAIGLTKFVKKEL